MNGLSRAASLDVTVPNAWSDLQPILTARVNQPHRKMKLSKEEAHSFVEFLESFHIPTPELSLLQKSLPKTTLELLMAVHARGLRLTEAEKMAAYLSLFMHQQQFQHPKPFDENTSHIIGREWNEIDYSGEGMTWQKQQQKYLPYGISNFKSRDNLIKFFKVESKLPYFKKFYGPKNNHA